MGKSGIELIEITQELYAVAKRIDEVSRTISKLARAKAEFERVYREALAKEILTLREQGIPATLISDLARGNVAYLKYERDLSQDLFKSGISALEAVKTQASVLQSISKYHEVI